MVVGDSYYPYVGVAVVVGGEGGGGGGGWGGVFFFQAEDGIRDLVRSRGLGDVYKRQDVMQAFPDPDGVHALAFHDWLVTHAAGDLGVEEPVSYTHLTLPTSDLV